MTDIPSPPSTIASSTWRFRSPALALALLTVVAGFADGHALSRFDVFVANQSGNIVRVGMGLVGQYAPWPDALVSLVGFSIGGVIGWWLPRISARRSLSLVHARLMTTALLIIMWFAAAVLSAPVPVLALTAAAAMGVMAMVLTHVAGVRAQPTFQSANVLSSGVGIAEWIAKDGGAGRTLALVGLLTIGCYALGGALGALTASSGPVALIALLLILVAVTALLRRGPATVDPAA